MTSMTTATNTQSAGAAQPATARAALSLRFRLGPQEVEFARAVVLKMLGRLHPDAEDVLQDALLQAHRMRGQFRGDSSFSTWIYTVVRSTVLMHVRYAKRRPQANAYVDVDDVVMVDHSTPEAVCSRRERLRIAGVVLTRVKEQLHRRAVELHLQGHKLGEIAGELGYQSVSSVVRAVYPNVHRMRDRIERSTR